MGCQRQHCASPNRSLLHVNLLCFPTQRLNPKSAEEPGAKRHVPSENETPPGQGLGAWRQQRGPVSAALLSILPPEEADAAGHVKTGDDVVQFYAKYGQGSAVRYFYCNRCVLLVLLPDYRQTWGEAVFLYRAHCREATGRRADSICDQLFSNPKHTEMRETKAYNRHARPAVRQAILGSNTASKCLSYVRHKGMGSHTEKWHLAMQRR